MAFLSAYKVSRKIMKKEREHGEKHPRELAYTKQVKKNWRKIRVCAFGVLTGF